jgi:hypothetical protein
VAPGHEGLAKNTRKLNFSSRRPAPWPIIHPRSNATVLRGQIRFPWIPAQAGMPEKQLNIIRNQKNYALRQSRPKAPGIVPEDQ